MYADGAARTLPNNAIPNFGWFIDTQPWYYNAAGEAGRSTVCATYSIRDVPGFCPAAGVTSFQTWLVGKSTTGSQFCLIRGYSWSVSRRKRRAGRSRRPARPRRRRSAPSDQWQHRG
jgi:hypothetical protein